MGWFIERSALSENYTHIYHETESGMTYARAQSEVWRINGAIAKAKDAERLLGETMQLVDLVRKLRGVLEEIQFYPDKDLGFDVCHYCVTGGDGVHDPSCKLSIALNASEGI